jgi:2-C-methyl-D-erythritol 4-phosphate cytidylyltransferase/2-C-methyl-D-erythritol 2,4-cyclodiphosphate synthase
MEKPTSSVRADAIVVAAGSSRRMGGVDKQVAPVGGRPLLAWTLAGLAASPVIERMVVVTSADRVDHVRDAEWLPAAVAAVVAGGARRQESVAAGAAELERLGVDDGRVVLVHDGARPVIRADLVERVAVATATYGAAIPVVPLTDTIKRLADGRVVETLDRAALAAAQTPQGMTWANLHAALELMPASGPATWTDEAALMEACRIAVHAIPGDPENLKVTTPADLDRMAAALGGVPGTRLGLGHDRHPFGPGEPLLLGGLRFDGAPRLHGHSDGDVALHAVADALLGAAGMGDLGRLFPSDSRTARGVASTELLEVVVERLQEAGLRPASLDLTIAGARPRLGGRLDEMRDGLAGLLGVAAARVSVKASSGNLDGMEGAGRGMSAIAVATVIADA